MTLGFVVVLTTQIVRWGFSYAPEDLPPSGVMRLFDAVAAGDTLALHRFMASGGDLDTVRDWACRGVYHVATASGQRDLIRWLLRRWGFLHDVAMIGGSPLHFAFHDADSSAHGGPDRLDGRCTVSHPERSGSLDGGPSSPHPF